MLKKMVAILSAGMMLVMNVFVVWQVFTRYVVGQPSVISVEVVRLALINLTFFGGVYCFYRRRHIAILLIDSWLPGPLAQRLLTFVRDLAALGYALVLLAGSLQLAWQQRQQSLPTLGLSMLWIYGMISVAAALLVLVCLTHLCARPRRGEGEPQ